MREDIKNLPKCLENLIFDYYNSIEVDTCWLCGIYLVPKLFMFDCFLSPRALCDTCYLCNMNMDYVCCLNHNIPTLT